MSKINFRLAIMLTARLSAYASAQELSDQTVTNLMEEKSTILKALEASAHQKESARPVTALILSDSEMADLSARLVSLEADLKKARSLKDNWTLSESDIKLQKAWKNAQTHAQAYSALKAWFESYGVMEEDSILFNELISEVGVFTKGKGTIRTRSTTARMSRRKSINRTTVETLYCILFDYCVEKNCIAPYNVPAICHEVYVQRVAELKALKKAEKEAKKKEKSVK